MRFVEAKRVFLKHIAFWVEFLYMFFDDFNYADQLVTTFVLLRTRLTVAVVAGAAVAVAAV